jgi:predicted Zn-dependent protease
MSRFFERLAKTSVSPPALLSTHPDPGDRARKAAEAARGAQVTLTLPHPPKDMKCREP